ncbi:hypothetical protein AAMO2058_001161800 [Amorphochlora amoebiformis]|uniref:Peptidase S54 rhomboid domain-containing protein n=1 Tax=Amorphochlora amoebiformis TaxID=1561963 RepID=A0A6T6Z313_9EUKA|mmetsp:Transcript_8214/g.12793  ORF Transcript_8214/g.12793 Transcript_8214/m.12793 type:complete len:359 (+) Transcript_8214:117-1193(+)
MQAQPQGRGGRCSEIMARLPFTTRVILAVNILVYFYELYNWDYVIQNYAFCSYMVHRGQYYRLITGAYLHGGILHIAMNMFTVFSLCIQIEQAIGSLALAGLTLAFTILSSSLEYFSRLMVVRASGDIVWLHSCSVGFSGVLFSFIVMHTYITRAENYNLCGLRIPAWLYPWVLLIGISVLFSGKVSFVGHLAGLLIGIAYVRGYLSILFPSRAALRRMEEWEYLSCLTESLMYSKCPVDPPIPTTDWISLTEICGRIYAELRRACDGISRFFQDAAASRAAANARAGAYEQVADQDPNLFANAPQSDQDIELAYSEGGSVEIGGARASEMRVVGSGPAGRSRLIDSIPRAKKDRGRR